MNTATHFWSHNSVQKDAEKSDGKWSKHRHLFEPSYLHTNKCESKGSHLRKKFVSGFIGEHYYVVIVTTDKFHGEEVRQLMS